MSFDFVSLVPAGDNPEAMVVLSKADPNYQEGHMPEDISKDGLAPEVIAYIAGLEAEYDTLQKDVDDLTAERDAAVKRAEDAEASGLVVKSEDEQMEALMKSAPPAVQALIKKSQEQAKQAEEIAKAERDARLDAEYISKAEALPNIEGDPATLGPVLRRLNETLTAEDAEIVNKALAAANAQLDASAMFAELGRSGGEVTISKAVEAHVAEVKKAHPEFTDEMALASVYDSHPDLLAEDMTGEAR